MFREETVERREAALLLRADTCIANLAPIDSAKSAVKDRGCVRACLCVCVCVCARARARACEALLADMEAIFQAIFLEEKKWRLFFKKKTTPLLHLPGPIFF